VTRSCCDHILGSNQQMFMNISLKDPRCFSSDHYMVVGKLQSVTHSSNHSYLRGRTRFPLRPLKWGPLTHVDMIFQALKRAEVPPLPRQWSWNAWISEETWKLVDERAAMRKRSGCDRTAYCHLDRRVKAALRADRTRQVEEAAVAIDLLLVENKLREAWNRTKAWYHHASD
jgi:hypothetical protein